MQFTPFHKDLGCVQPEDLALLKHVSEGWYIEYKSKIINQPDLAKALSSFANQHGGWLLLGVTEDKNTHFAGSFPGIPNERVQSGLESLRNAAKDTVRPSVFYETQVFKGPVDSIELAEGSSLIVVRVPEGPNTPYVHNNGRIYRRIADSSDPKPETDRATLDLLFPTGSAISNTSGRVYYSQPTSFQGRRPPTLSPPLYFFRSFRNTRALVQGKLQGLQQSDEDGDVAFKQHFPFIPWFCG